jgi:UDP-3-O-[3-hydroxymyristoyl] N-acetylglucosamine deacetylase
MKQQNIDIYQRTVNNPTSFIGRGLHSGLGVSMQIKPAVADTGIVFKRIDLPSNTPVIPARWYNVLDTDHGTTLGLNDTNQVKTVEHLMAALFGMGIDNAIVEVDGPEVPILDGSSLSFASLFNRIGVVQQQSLRSVIAIHNTLEFREGDSFATISPASTSIINTHIDFAEPVIGAQSYSMHLEPESYLKELASSRTFACDRAVSVLRHKGLAQGASIKSGIYIRNHTVLNPGGLRFKDEFVRHKMSDFIGDMALGGHIIYGEVTIHRPGHSFNNNLMHHLFSSVEHWSYESVDSVQKMAVANERMVKSG